MTLDEMLLQTMRQMEEDEAALPGYRDLATAYLNEALADITALELTAEEKLGSAAATVTLTGLTEKVYLVLDVKDKDGNSIPFSVANDKVTSTNGTLIASVKYRYVPRLMVSGTDTPLIPQVWHGALADYATWRMLGLGGRGRQMKGEFFGERYLQVKGRVTDWLKCATRGRRLNHRYG